MKIKQKSIKYNFIMNVILTMSSFIFPLITFPYVSRIFSSAGIGKISFATSIIAYFAMIAQMGIPTYGIRACAKVRDDPEKLNSTASEILSINFFMTIFAYLILGIVIIFVPKIFDDRILIFIISSTMIFNMIGMEWLYKALEQYSYITVRSIVFKFIAMILMFVLVREKNDYLIYGALTIFAASASNILNFMNAHKFINFKFIKISNLKKHLKPIFIFFAMSCSVTIYTNLDTIMLGFMTTDSEVGYYNVAIKVRAVLLSLITSLGTVILPRASYYVQNNMLSEFEIISKKAVKFVAIISLPIWIFFTIYSKETVLMLSGEDFLNSVKPMVFLLPTLIFVGLSNITGIQMLIPLDKEKHVLYSEMIGAIVNLIFNIILISKLGCVGAAIGTLLAEISVFLYQYIVLNKCGYKTFKGLNLLPETIDVLILIPILILIKFFISNVFVSFITGALLYFGIYIIILFLQKNQFVIETYNEVKNKIWRKYEKS